MSQQSLPPLDAQAILAIVEDNWVRWGWDKRGHKVVVGTLSKGTNTIAPLDNAAAATIVSQAREGCGLFHALKDADISQRRFFAWIYAAHSPEPAAAPYREFRQQLPAAIDDNEQRSGVRDEQAKRQLALLVDPPG